MKQFLVIMFIMVLIPSILKCSYLTNSFKSFKFKIYLVPPSINLVLIIYLWNISSKLTCISTSSSGEKLGLFALCFIGIPFSKSVVSPLIICNINLSDASFPTLEYVQQFVLHRTFLEYVLNLPLVLELIFLETCYSGFPGLFWEASPTST